MSLDLDDVPPPYRRAAAAALAAAGVDDGHLAVELVGEGRIRELNAGHRGKDAPTDVLSFPIDGAAETTVGPRELGDVVICPQHTADLTEAVVHGVLHLCGYDHERDDGQMLALQQRVLADLGSGRGYEIRAAERADADATLAMYEWLFAPPASVPTGWDPVAARERLLAAIGADDATVLVADDGERLLGLCSAYIDLLSVRFGLRCWVEDLAVDPEHRSRGIGAALLDAARAWGADLGATNLALSSSDARPDAHRFYEREQPTLRSRLFGWALQR